MGATYYLVRDVETEKILGNSTEIKDEALAEAERFASEGRRVRVDECKQAWPISANIKRA
jgi:hypothetical protein